MGATLDWHEDGRDGPTILMLSWFYYQAALIGRHLRFQGRKAL